MAAKKAKKKKRRALRWEADTTVYASVLRNGTQDNPEGRRLIIGINKVPRTPLRRKTQWATFAVEATAGQGLGLMDPREMMSKIFDEHSHQILELRPTFAAAKKQAEAFARWWQRAKPIATPCECDDITAGGNPSRLGPDA